MSELRGTVLVVDDERPIRDATTQALQLAGFTAMGCESAERALRHIAADALLVLVSDVRMPGINGLELLRRSRAQDADLPVVLISGHGDIAMAVQAIRDGAYDFIEKPFSTSQLVEVVNRAMEKRRLVLENRALRTELAERDPAAGPIIGRTPAIERLRNLIATVADTDADVLILGETGTGKELVAHTLHALSRRRERNFVALNCGAMPEPIFESELFGHEAGSFTGALRRRVGRVEFAHKGTLFLDEIESMPLSLQVKLLRVLQERVVEPLGSNARIAVDLRVVAASKVDLRQASADNRFREDLYYRLNVVMIAIPPLRERRDDIPLLFQHFALMACARYQRPMPVISPAEIQALMAWHWPGNVRELRNVADRAVLGLDDAFSGFIPASPAPLPPSRSRLSLSEQVDQFEKRLLETTLASHKGNIKATFEALGLPRKTFYDKMRKHGLVRADFLDGASPVS